MCGLGFNLDYSDWPAREANPQLHTEHKSLVAIPVVANPQFRVGGPAARRWAAAHLAGDPGMIQFMADLCHLRVVR